MRGRVEAAMLVAWQMIGFTMGFGKVIEFRAEHSIDHFLWRAFLLIACVFIIYL